MSELSDLPDVPAYDELAAELISAANTIPEHAKVLTDAAAVLISEHNKIIAQDDFPLGKACDLSGEGGCEACQ